MPIDFTRVGASQRAALIHPRDIFTGLPYKPWPRLRLEQGEVLEGWFNKRSRRDVVIKQKTQQRDQPRGRHEIRVIEDR
jgi:hypothetical protein